MSITVVAYRNGWPALFAEEASRLGVALEPWLTGPMEHIGSTAIPGLAAKPVLDMLAPVADLQAARAAQPALAELGYTHAQHRPHEALWFYRQHGDSYDSRTHQLHLTEPSSALWRERLTFRDALRGDPALLSEYQQLKTLLATRAGDLSGYTDGKRAFVARVLAGAGVALAPPAS